MQVRRIQLVRFTVSLLLFTVAAALSCVPACAEKPRQSSDVGYFDIEEFTRTLSNVLLLEYCDRGTSLRAPDVEAITNVGTQLLATASRIAEQANASSDATWYGLRSEMLGHITLAVASIEEGETESAKRHLIEADYIFEYRMKDDDEARTPPGSSKEEALRLATSRTIKWRRLIYLPAALTAYRCADLEVAEGYFYGPIDEPGERYWMLEAGAWANRGYAIVRFDKIKAIVKKAGASIQPDETESEMTVVRDSRTDAESNYSGMVDVLTRLGDEIGESQAVEITQELDDKWDVFHRDDFHRFDSNRDGLLHHSEILGVLRQLELEWKPWLRRFGSEIDQFKRSL